MFQIDTNADGFIDFTELKDALDLCGFKMPGWKIRRMIEEYDEKKEITHQGRLSFLEFEKVCSVCTISSKRNKYVYKINILLLFQPYIVLNLFAQVFQLPNILYINKYDFYK